MDTTGNVPAKEIRSRAWHALAEGGAYWRTFAGFLLIQCLAVACFIGFVAVTAAALDAAGGLDDLMDVFGAVQSRNADAVRGAALALAENTSAVLVWGVALTVGSVLLVWLWGFVAWGATALGIATMRRGVKVSHAFSGRGHAWHMGWIEVVRVTYIQLWACLFLIPGIVKGFSYAMTRFVAVDHPDWNATQCITESRRLMKGHKMEFFVLYLTFVPWYVLAMAATYVPYVGNLASNFLSPYVKTAEAAFYEHLLDLDEASAPAEAAPAEVVSVGGSAEEIFKEYK